MDKSISVILRPITRFATQKSTASILLFVATILAMFFANSQWSDVYNSILLKHVDLKIAGYVPFMHHGEPMSVLSFVNDALMAIFFFVIGLEIKQEVLIGELSSWKKSVLPVIAACGGMIVPVLTYYLVCPTAPELNGVAIPMATDIAFALAVLGLLGDKVPLSMRIFLTALAVVDDIGGILVIAIFYSDHIAYTPLLLSMAILVGMYFGGKMGIHKKWFYYSLGFIVWTLFMKAGIHPTIAGVLVAFTVPARPRLKIKRFSEDMNELISMLKPNDVKSSDKASVLSNEQIEVLNSIHLLADRAVSPLQSMTKKLHHLVNLFILPVFAFVNAGVTLGEINPSSIVGVPLAIFLGLFIGKTLGIFIFTYGSVKLKIATMPKEVTKSSLFGVCILGGIGFTVSLFIANLSFGGVDTLLNQAKLGVFAGSLVSGIVGYFVLRIVLRKKVVEA
jgi:NhaA family Na+:H+ antiporter